MANFYRDIGLAVAEWNESGGWLLVDGSGWWVIPTRAEAVEMGWTAEYLDGLTNFTDAEAVVATKS